MEITIKGTCEVIIDLSKPVVQIKCEYDQTGTLA